MFDPCRGLRQVIAARTNLVTALVEKRCGRCWEGARADAILTLRLLWSPILAEMETQMDTGPRHNQSQDELLASYEAGVWIFLGVVGLALFGIIVWIGLLVL
jgi:hypothetical protein